jgi:hypothetical protein
MLPEMTSPSSTRQQLGVLLAGGGAAMLALLLAHPHERIQTFTNLIDLEIRQQGLNALVHGGAIVALVVLLSGHAGLMRLAGSANVAATVAVTVFGAACVLLGAHLVLDGFVTPVLALQFRAAQDETMRQAIEALIRFCGGCERVLMRLALLSFAASALTWCGPQLQAGGRGRLAAALGGIIGASLGTMMLLVTPGLFNHAVMAGLVLVAVWQLALAWVLLKREAPLPS